MNYEKAHDWADKANADKEIDYIEPRWSWDCCLKLDFDGGLLRVSSRFYQVKTDIFDGSVSFYIGDEEICDREFSGRHIDVLKKDVEEYVESVTEKVRQLLSANLSTFVMGIER